MTHSTKSHVRSRHAGTISSTCTDVPSSSGGATLPHPAVNAVISNAIFIVAHRAHDPRQLQVQHGAAPILDHQKSQRTSQLSQRACVHVSLRERPVANSD